MIDLSNALSIRKVIMASYKINANEFEKLAQHYFFLAYQECNSKFQAHTNISIDTVLDHCNSSFGQEGMIVFSEYWCESIADNMVYLAIRLHHGSSIVFVPDFKPNPSIQAWLTGQFKTFDELLQQAAKNADVNLNLLLASK